MHFYVLSSACQLSPPVFFLLHSPLPVLLSTQIPESNLLIFCEISKYFNSQDIVEN